MARPRSGAMVTPHKGDLTDFDRDLPKQVVLRHFVMVIPAHRRAHSIARMRTPASTPTQLTAILSFDASAHNQRSPAVP
jgi:hypothetical protein